MRVMEARLVTYNGFSISLATEWIENPEDGDYDKPDCERKAFFSIKIEKSIPSLTNYGKNRISLGNCN